jgi:hypothetical protein
MIKFESKEQARAARYPQAPKLPPTKWATEGNMPKYEQAELGPKEGQIRARTFFLKWWTRIGGRLRWPGHYITVKEIYHDGRWSITDEWHDDDDEMSLADILNPIDEALYLRAAKDEKDAKEKGKETGT